MAMPRSSSDRRPRRGSLLILAIASIARGAGEPPDLVVNGELSAPGAAGLPDAWRIERFAGKGGVTMIEDAEAGDGAAIQIAVAAPEQIAPGTSRGGVQPLRIAQELSPAPQGKLLELEVRLAVDELLEGEAEARLEILGAGSPRPILGARSTRFGSVTRGYVEASVRVYVPDGASVVVASVDLAGSGRVRVDRVVAHATAAPDVAPEVNLLANASFEEGLASWEFFGGDVGAVAEVHEGEARTGSRVARITRPVAEGPRRLPNVGQEVIAPGFSGKRVEVSGAFRARGVAGKAFLGLFFQGMKGDGAFTQFVALDDAFVSGDEGWVVLRQEVDLRGLDVHAIVVRACLDGTGSVDVDDLSLRIVPQQRPAPPGWALAAAAVFAAIAAWLLARRRARRSRK